MPTPCGSNSRDGTTSSVSYRRAAYSLQFYRKGALDYARDFCIYAESEIGLITANDEEFAVVQTPALSFERIDDIIGDAFEERALINLLIDYTHTTNQATGDINAFDGSIDYGGITTTVQTHP